ncbi:hypothetical protein [Agrococcus sp. HG114]|uniref:hypothetical protein n=1 Tax=Agrococcus sp. HG114 TaxID=2969757 RepID=UPI00215B507E|nr:hypothetical protein [Agrococcus sp. HG114]MCR8669668.1 hypothetical protein [Agrococcus sp. HG114]
MLLIVTCAALLAAGVALAVAWGDERLVEPAVPASPGRPRRAALALYGRWLLLLAIVGAGSGVLIAAAGGRLAMRLLAATSPSATGRLTEGQAVVGEITLEGTAALAAFGALPLALASAALYLLAAPWLPRGRLAGWAFGALLLVIGAPLVDPLRADNVDFDLLGPGWLAVLALGALVVVHGAAVAAIAGRASRALSAPTRTSRAVIVAGLVLSAPVLAIAAVLAAPLVLVSALGVAALPRALPALLAARASTRGVLLGRLVLGVAAAVALPAFVAAVVSIAGR